MKTVKKAVIPAAGLGSRMFPYTKHINKLMVPILNKPVVQYLVDEIVASGIKEVIISGRYLDIVKDYFRYDKNLVNMTTKFGHKGAQQLLKIPDKKCKIIFLEQKQPKGWMYELYNARKYLKKEPFAVVFSDIVYCTDKPVLKQMIGKFKETNHCIYANGRYIMKPENVFPLLEKRKFVLGDDFTAVNEIVKKLNSLGKITYMPINEKCFHIGNLADFIKANICFAMKDPELRKELKSK